MLSVASRSLTRRCAWLKPRRKRLVLLHDPRKRPNRLPLKDGVENNRLFRLRPEAQALHEQVVGRLVFARYQNFYEFFVHGSIG